MLSLASVAVGVSLALASGVYAVARVDALDYRTVLVAAAVTLAVGGAAAQMAPPDAGQSEVAATAENPAAVAVADAETDAVTNATAEATATDDANATATVVGVAAGDWVTYRTASGAVRRVRLAGIDAPGVDGADPRQFDGVVTGRWGRECLADQGRRAVRALRGRLLGETVTVRTVERTGVQTAVLAHDGRSVNRHLVERGYARARGERYADAERGARSATAGVWSCTVVNPDRPLREANESGLHIAAVHPNPPGDDAAALEDEYIVVENTGRKTIDLSAWHLVVDESYFFFDGPELRPGEELVVHVGAGRDTDRHVYLGADHPILDNARGTLKLVDGGSDRVVRLSY